MSIKENYSMTYLYKYRSFEPNTLRMLCESEVYFSDPSIFNDPLECSPTVIVDVSLDDLEKLYCKIIGEDFGRFDLSSFRQNSDENGAYRVSDDFYRDVIAGAIKSQLDIRIKKNQGVLSLAGQWNSPLMWSHYADEHKGICIEYDASLSVCDPPKRVDYEGERGILASEIISWVFNDSTSAKERIEQKYFYTKANQWKYEEEWRYIQNSQGRQQAPFHIAGIYFGMRCERSVASSIVRLLRDSTPKLNFYRVSPNPNSFELVRTELDDSELDDYYKPTQSAALVFGKPIKHPDLV
ncbi:MAG: DUF2971 domain-containing protein [Betaproteobacteria bacterium]|nr:DUF2971 domain-containing protein [Betaproteobacteria bacterium]